MRFRRLGLLGVVLALGSLVFLGSAAGADVPSSCVEVLGDAECEDVAVSGAGSAEGEVAVSGTGPADGYAAASATGDAEGCAAASGTGSAHGWCSVQVYVGSREHVLPWAVSGCDAVSTHAGSSAACLDVDPAELLP